jgi:uncharacterized paraquat-inducible protein A
MFVRSLLARSPRVMCEQCQRVSLIASLDASFFSSEMHCPRCNSKGPFRAPTQAELAEQVPESQRVWPTVVSVMLVLLPFIVFFFYTHRQ